MARPRQVSDEEILEAARSCFLEDPNVSTQVIADRIGLSQAALFKRFGTKMRLMLASMGVEEGPPWVGICERGPDDRPIPEQLQELGTTLLAFFRTLVPHMMAMRALGVDFKQMFGACKTPPPVVGFHALSGWFRRAIEQDRIAPSDPGGLAIAFLGMFNTRAFWSHVASGHFPTPLADDDVYVEHVVQVFWRGVAPEEGR